ncbi:MAG: hypothetical protein ACYSWR_01960 [Planctomycetota bacterium]|jgi:transcription elongation factor Elf1
MLSQLENEHTEEINLFSHWLDSCLEPCFCDGSDFDESGSMDFTDIAFLANEWLQDLAP